MNYADVQGQLPLCPLHQAEFGDVKRPLRYEVGNEAVERLEGGGYGNSTRSGISVQDTRRGLCSQVSVLIYHNLCFFCTVSGIDACCRLNWRQTNVAIVANS